MNVCGAQARGKCPTKVVKVKVVQSRILDGSLKAVEQLPALSACSLWVKDRLIIGCVLIWTLWLKALNSCRSDIKGLTREETSTWIMTDVPCGHEHHIS